MTVSVCVERDRSGKRIEELQKDRAKTIDSDRLTGARKIKAEEDHHMKHIKLEFKTNKDLSADRN